MLPPAKITPTAEHTRYFCPEAPGALTSHPLAQGAAPGVLGRHAAAQLLPHGSWPCSGTSPCGAQHRGAQPRAPLTPPSPLPTPALKALWQLHILAAAETSIATLLAETFGFSKSPV